MKKIVMMTTVVAVTVLSLVGCGGGGDVASSFTAPKVEKTPTIIKLAPDMTASGEKVIYFFDRYTKNRQEGMVIDGKMVKFNNDLKNSINSELMDVMEDWMNFAPMSVSTSAETWSSNMDPFRKKNSDGTKSPTNLSNAFETVLSNAGLKMGSGLKSSISWGADSNMTDWFNKSDKHFNFGEEAVCAYTQVRDLTPFAYTDGTIEDKGVVIVCGNFSRK